jgi:hypothetical protein
MKRMNFNTIAFTFSLLSIVIFGCNNETSKQEIPQTKQLNISVMLDLSDRIDPNKHPASPEHAERDKAIVQKLIEYFKENMKSLGTYNSKGRFKVYMEPAPAIANIETLQQKLYVDCSTMHDVKEKKNVFDSIENNFMNALDDIYAETIRINNYPGSDIWRFFKNDVDLCISSDTNYRNILVILTDGYIYDETTTQKVGSRVQNLTVSTIGKYRANADPISAMDMEDFGLISCRNDLQNLEVLMLEIAPENNSQKDEDILIYCIEKWLKEMGVSNYAVYKSDLPTKTAQRIGIFLDK